MLRLYVIEGPMKGHSFDLKEDETIVTSQISFYKNPKVSKKPKELFLNGEFLELLSIEINGTDANHELKDDGLLLIEPPDSFILETIVRIHPESNTRLNGLYQSSGNFCTQCEAHGFRQITYYLDRPDILSIFTTHIKANKDRDRMVPEDILLQTHEGAGKTMWEVMTKILPKGLNGVNDGISLSLWDYIFKTNYIPEESGTVEIGFEGDDVFPHDFVGQNLYGFKKGQK